MGRWRLARRGEGKPTVGGRASFARMTDNGLAAVYRRSRSAGPRATRRPDAPLQRLIDEDGEVALVTDR